LLWRWIALAESMWSLAVSRLVNPQTQDKPTQDDISVTAVRHGAAAARWAASAKDSNLALTVARALYNAALPLSASSVTRPSLVPALVAALEALKACGETTDLDFRVQLYKVLQRWSPFFIVPSSFTRFPPRFQLLFQAVADTRNWSYGLQLAEEAFQVLPPAQSNALWPDRVLFMSRLGQVCASVACNFHVFCFATAGCGVA
jgi:hypothetical protein